MDALKQRNSKQAAAALVADLYSAARGFRDVGFKAGLNNGQLSRIPRLREIGRGLEELISTGTACLTMGAMIAAARIRSGGLASRYVRALVGVTTPLWWVY